MKAAFAVHDGRIAPVFDTARRMCVVTAEAGRIADEELVALPGDAAFQKAAQIAGLGIEVLVCGAISGPLQAQIAAYGIKVISFIAGDLRDVMSALLSDTINEDRFMMPGCCGRGRRARGRGCNPGRKRHLGARGRGQGRGGCRNKP